MPSSWLAWQLVDSAFPTGGFAHSWGLEAAWQHGEADDAAALREFLRHAILQTERAVLPLVNAVHRSPDRLEELDLLCDAFLTNAVANRASRVQGRSLAATCARVWPTPALTAIARRMPGLCGHFGPIAGAVFRALDVSSGTSRQVVLYSTTRGVLAAAVRLGLAGSYEAQQLQHDCAMDLDAALRRSARLDAGDLAQPAPIADLFQATHDRLYSRLFQS